MFPPMRPSPTMPSCIGLLVAIVVVSFGRRREPGTRLPDAAGPARPGHSRVPGQVVLALAPVNFQTSGNRARSLDPRARRFASSTLGSGRRTAGGPVRTVGDD